MDEPRVISEIVDCTIKFKLTSINNNNKVSIIISVNLYLGSSAPAGSANIWISLGLYLLQMSPGIS